MQQCNILHIESTSQQLQVSNWHSVLACLLFLCLNNFSLSLLFRPQGHSSVGFIQLYSSSWTLSCSYLNVDKRWWKPKLTLVLPWKKKIVHLQNCFFTSSSEMTRLSLNLKRSGKFGIFDIYFTRAKKKSIQKSLGCIYLCVLMQERSRLLDTMVTRMLRYFAFQLWIF